MTKFISMSCYTSRRRLSYRQVPLKQLPGGQFSYVIEQYLWAWPPHLSYQGLHYQSTLIITRTPVTSFNIVIYKFFPQWICVPQCSIERVEEFKYLGTTLTNQNSIQEEIKSRLKLGNVCYYSVQNLLSSSLLSKNLKIKVYRTLILPVVLYWCETWSLTLRGERRLRVFEIGCWGECLGLRRTG